MTSTIPPPSARARQRRSAVGAAVLAAAVVALVVTSLPISSALATTRVEIDGPPLTRFWVDGREVGVLPLADPLLLPPGTYQLRAKLPGHRDYDQALRVSDDEDVLFLRIRLTRLSRTKAMTSNLLLAGLGQHYLGRPVRGYVFNSAFLGGLFVALAAEVQRSNTNNDYVVFQQRYNEAFDPEDIELWRARADKAYQDSQDLADLRNTGLKVTLGALLLSMIDAMLFFPDYAGAPEPASPVSFGGSLPGPDTEASLNVRVRLEF